MTKISYFNSVNDTVPKEYDLEKWLKMTIDPPSDLLEKVEEYRSTLETRVKRKLPCVTISASFQGIRNLENIKEKNRLICIDIDRFSKSKKNKSNICIDMLLVKEMFMQHPSTLYTGYSVSGDGVYAIIRIFDAEALPEYFDFFQAKFAHIGINIDNSCKDYTRLRFFSVDKEAYYNPKALFYKKNETESPVPAPAPVEPEAAAKKVSPNEKQRAYEVLDNWNKAKRVTDLAEQQRVDITSSYQDWFKIGGALYNEFGEDGRNLFHRLSSIHSEYSYKECDDKFNQCKKLNKVNFSTFLYIAGSYGIKYVEN